jgi:hypothetical protein
MTLAKLAFFLRSPARRRLPALASVAATLLLPPAAQSQTATEPAATVITIVKVPTPWYAPRSVVVGRMIDTLALYANMPGLSYKAYSFARPGGEYGGLYYWQDVASAKAWYNPAWFERVRKERGKDGTVRYLDALLSIDNTPGGTPADNASPAVATLVEIPIPAGVGRDRLYAEFKAAVPTYQQVPGLMRKHFTVSELGTFGGLYLWKDEASAKAWFTQAWRDRVVKTYGTAAKIEWFDTPILMPTQRADNAAAPGALVMARP